ncbi:MAG: hypothetical protein O7D30_11950 [Rickettsia endosymbiont of Ixodes persulcatus]|nr:hypothetical protein [Rickettsia endosymbiont of Ixodes persulcatus]
MFSVYPMPQPITFPMFSSPTSYYGTELPRHCLAIVAVYFYPPLIEIVMPFREVYCATAQGAGWIQISQSLLEQPKISGDDDDHGNDKDNERFYDGVYRNDERR